MLKPGDDVDSWCGKCKRILAHTIQAMVDDLPARVTCNTCKAQHKYKAEAPKSARKRKVGDPALAPTRKIRATQYQKLLSGQDISLAKRYSPKDSYLLGDVVEHASFGVGVTTIVKAGSKIDVIFEDGVKTLIHER